MEGRRAVCPKEAAERIILNPSGPASSQQAARFSPRLQAGPQTDPVGLDG